MHGSWELNIVMADISYKQRFQHVHAAAPASFADGGPERGIVTSITTLSSRGGYRSLPARRLITETQCPSNRATETQLRVKEQSSCDTPYGNRDEPSQSYGE